MTFLLMFTVLQTGNRAPGCIAIGLAVFLAHSVLLPVDGCSINPTRSFGPALVASCRKNSSDLFQDMWVFWLGPLAGAPNAQEKPQDQWQGTPLHAELQRQDSPPSPALRIPAEKSSCPHPKAPVQQ